MDIIERVSETILAHNMICENDNVVVGLSGGADSVFLLNALHILSLMRMKFTLEAVHVNHCLRDEESDRDERFCTELCGRRGIKLTVKKVDVIGFSQKHSKSIEEAARILRYEAFEEAAHGGKIATAHNKGDNAETVIFNLIRGTGIKGICGIPYVRGNIIRPLLDISREEIEQWHEQTAQTFVTDSTNLTEDYTRNKIRRKLIPMMKEINPNVIEAVSRLSACADEAQEMLDLCLGRFSERICECPAAVRKKRIAEKLAENGIEYGFERICEIDSAVMSGKNTKINLSGNVFAVIGSGDFEICKQHDYKPFEQCFAPKDFMRIDIPEYDKTVIIERICDDFFSDNCNVKGKLTNIALNYVKIQGVVSIRNKRDGDVIRLRGREFSTKLKKLYNSMKISRDQRLTALVIEDKDGIIWSEYGGACNRCAADCTEKCGDIYKITVRRFDDAK